MFLIIKLCLILCWERINLLANKKSTQREQVYTIITIQVAPNNNNNRPNNNTSYIIYDNSNNDDTKLKVIYFIYEFFNL